MIVSVYSFLMAVCWSSLFILLLCICRRNSSFILGFGVWPLLAIVLCSAARCFLPLEMPSFTQALMGSGAVTRIDGFFNTSIAWLGFTPVQLIGLIWLTGILFFLSRSLRRYGKFCKLLRAFEPVTEEDVPYAEAQEVASQLGVRDFAIFMTSVVRSPMVTGFCRPVVLFPLHPYSSEDYRNILEHEFTHWKNGDIWVKLMAELVRDIFWWNPLVYWLYSDLTQTLELRCDIMIAKKRDLDGRIAYVHTLEKAAEFAKGKPDLDFLVAAIAEFTQDEKERLFQRVNAILNYKHRPKIAAIATAVTSVFMAVLMVASYSFVIQPYYEAPEDEIKENIIGGNTCVEILSEDSYLVDNHDGTYSLYNNGHLKTIIPDESVQFLIDEGFSIRPST